MSDTIIRIDDVSKQYRLGEVGTGTLAHDLNRWWHLLRGKSDPYARVGESNQRDTVHESPYVWALKNVSFDVHRGQVVGIIGRNGAGKSTLLKILSRVTQPTSGRVMMKGRIASLLEVGTGFHPELTGRENIYLNGAILGMRKEEIARQFDAIVDFSGCARYIDTPVKRYSSGMYVRLAFAVAAHLDPDILIIDEVLAVGDAEFQERCLGRMRDVAGGGRTVLFVSHNMAAVQSLCGSVVVLDAGVAKTYGEPALAIRKYLRSAQQQASTEWIGLDGNHQLQLTRLRVYSAAESEALTTGAPLNVEFELNVNEWMSNVSIAFHLKTQSGVDLAFSALHDRRSLSERYDLSTGKYMVRATIPANTLAQGHYVIEPNIGEHNRQRIVERVALHFTLTNSDGIGRRFLTGSGLESRFRPAWEWTLMPAAHLVPQ